MRALPFFASLLAGILVARAALADRVLALPSKGIGADLGAAAKELGHEPVAEADVAAALGKVADGSADTAEEYAALAAATDAAWVVSGAEVDPGRGRIEVTAYSAEAGRVESVARNVDRQRAGVQVREMLAVLLRPEGVGTGALPWEKEAQPGRREGSEGQATVRYGREVEPPAFPPPSPPRPYGVPFPWFVGGDLGTATAVLRPKGSVGAATSLAGDLRFGRALGETGLELFGQLGGNLLGPRVLWLEGGGRFGFARVRFFGMVGYALATEFALRVHGGAAARLGSSAGPEGTRVSAATSFHPTLGGGLDLILRLRDPNPAGSGTLQVEAGFGNPRLFFFDGGTVLTLGTSLGVAYRF